MILSKVLMATTWPSIKNPGPYSLKSSTLTTEITRNKGAIKVQLDYILLLIQEPNSRQCEISEMTYYLTKLLPLIAVSVLCSQVVMGQDVTVSTPTVAGNGAVTL